mmetsp:Transcript_37660/g.88438  ORF Transcript_37660/g.88438 Transcript_37660/m.88438 type:complete len:123 (-) Transcript_37660:783-1151(-)
MPKSWDGWDERVRRERRKARNFGCLLVACAMLVVAGAGITINASTSRTYVNTVEAITVAVAAWEAGGLRDVEQVRGVTAEFNSTQFALARMREESFGQQGVSFGAPPFVSEYFEAGVPLASA